jgi:elongation factor G
VIEAVKAARPILLEPIVNIEIMCPETSIGDLAGDLSSKRGHVTSTQPRGSGVAISGEVPLAELNDYQSRLRSLTSGQGAYSLEFSRYAAVPPAVQQALMSQFKAEEDD